MSTVAYLHTHAVILFKSTYHGTVHVCMWNEMHDIPLICVGRLDYALFQPPQQQGGQSPLPLSLLVVPSDLPPPPEEVGVAMPCLLPEPRPLPLLVKGLKTLGGLPRERPQRSPQQHPQKVWNVESDAQSKVWNFY